MSAPSGRPTRSRVSTPNVSTPKDSSKESAEKNGTMKSKRGPQEGGWQEPPIPPPKPSFADAGMERHGVVANMAPLGTYPTAKIMKALMKGDQYDGSGRARRRETSVASTPAESLNTPTRTPEPTHTPEQSQPLESLELSQMAEPVDMPKETDGGFRRSNRRSASARVEEGKPRSATPQALSVASVDTRMSLPAQSPLTTNGFHSSSNSRPVSEANVSSQGFVPITEGKGAIGPQPSPLPYVIGNSLNHQPQVATPVLPLPLPPIGPDGEFMVDLALTERVLEYACQHALDDGKYPTAYALRTMYDDLKNHNPSVRMMEALYGGFATPGQRKEFLTQIETRKRGGKKDRTAEIYFNGDSNDLPIPPRRSSLFSPTGSMNNNMTIYTAVLPTPYQTPYSPLVGSAPASATFVPSDPAARQPSLDLRSPTPSVHSDAEVDGEPPTKKQKITDFYHSRIEMNGEAAKSASVRPEASDELPDANELSFSPNQRGSRSRSVSSSSSALSSVNEELLNAPNSAFNSPVKTQRHESPPLSDTPPSLPVRENLDGLAYKNAFYTNPYFNPPPKPFISPYASKENFIRVAAETLAGTPGVVLPTPPITTQPKAKGPKKYTFPVTKSQPSASAPAPPPSSTPENLPNNAEQAQSPSPSTQDKSSMAPAAIESSTTTITSSNITTTTSAEKQPAKSALNTRTNRLNKEKATKAQTPTPPEPYDPNDTPNRLKRQARERTNRKPDNESNERHRVISPPPPEAESDADSIAINISNKRAKKTLKIRAPITRARRNNDDSDENQSSPTVLSFHPDIAPGSLSASRAGTPNIFSRPTRKGKTGTGLRVKTS